MAEFALGLTKTAVEGTVRRVKSAIEEEEKVRFRVQNDLVFITGEFEMMQSFLKVANKERAKNEVVRTWVRQIRNLAFDVEDCVELSVSLDIKSGWSWLWRVVPSCMAPPRPLDLVVMEIQRLKARVEDVSQRNTRYNLISDSGSSSSSSGPALVTSVSSPELELMPSATANTSTSAAAFHILHEVWEASGKMRHGTSNLKMLIRSEGSHREVISLYIGMVEEATAAPRLIRDAYNDPKIHQEFCIRAWVKLTEPFNVDDFLSTLLTQFDATSTHHHPGATSVVGHSVDIKTRLREQLTQERYLVILEDVSTVVDWDVISKYLPDTNKGSRIIVSTQHLGLAFSCTGKPYQVSDLRQFSHGQSLCAFIKKSVGGAHAVGPGQLGRL